jgi:hypothetical protein
MMLWQKVWREGVAPLLSKKALASLREALAADDGRLQQGCTTTPPPLECVHSWPVEGACGLGWCGWQGEGLQTVGEVEEYFARLCYEVDARMQEPAAVRWFLNWFDETPRDQMRAALLPEVIAAIARAEGGAA